MKIIYASDIHCGITRYDTLKSFALEIRKENPDLVILGGDIGESLNSINHVEVVLKSIECKLSVVLGNHDLWCHEDSKYTSLDLFNYILPEMFEKHKVTHLESENCVVGDVAVVGSYLHYDYSAKEKYGVCGTLPDAFYASNKKKVMADGIYLRGIPSDIEFSKEIASKFSKRLSNAQQDNNVQKIVVATHVSCCKYQIDPARQPNNYNWAVGTAYFGNLSSWNNISQCSKLSNVCSGHSHRGMLEKVLLNGNQEVEIYNSFSDYGKPQYHVMEF